MPQSSIERRGGPRARLSVFRPTGIAALLAPVVMALPFTSPPAARTDPFPLLLGLDYDRQVAMPIDAPAPLPGTRSDSLPRFSASLTGDYGNLIRKTGNFSFDHSGSAAALNLGTRAIPNLDLRLSTAAGRADLDMGDSSARVDLGGSNREWTVTAAYLLTPWLVPSVQVGEDSRNGHGDAVKALSLQGRLPFGVEWSAGLGTRNFAFPVTVSLPEYETLAVGLRLKRGFRDLALGMHRGPWEASWGGHWEDFRFPSVRPEGYSLADSGFAWKHSVQAAFDRIRGREGYRISLDLDAAYGSHAFRGMDRKAGSLHDFSYQEAETKSYSVRADAKALCGRWEWGAFAGGAETEWDALRPDAAFNRYFWNRNGAIDSYQGGLLGVFDNETWLLNGAVYLAQAGGGIWAASEAAGFRFRLGLGFQHVILEANSHLTRRETTLLFAYKERNIDTDYPSVHGDFLSPEARLSRQWGACELAFTATQALPIQIRLEKKDEGGSDGGAGGESAGGPAPRSDYSGGTRLRLELSWHSR